VVPAAAAGAALVLVVPAPVVEVVPPVSPFPVAVPPLSSPPQAATTAPKPTVPNMVKAWRRSIGLLI
jgi:hypothetical protein